MPTDPDGGLTDELAEQIHAELEAEPEDETRSFAAARPGEPGLVEIVLHDAAGGRPEVTAELTHEQAQALAAALVALAADDA